MNSKFKNEKEISQKSKTISESLSDGLLKREVQYITDKM